MASSEHPETPPLTTGIQTPSGLTAPAEAPSVPLPPLPRPPVLDATRFLRLRSWLDALLVVMVLLFAFLVASFPASNPDFFRQAAIGRLLLQGQYRFGVDPFVYTAGDAYFVNHSWLFALLMYGLYQLPAGGAVVVIFKALLIAALAAVLLRAGRHTGDSLWIPAACTALAILVASPRLYLQSTCLSFLFLGVTFWLLTAVGKEQKRLLWLLPPLFALWVNCDSWFFLGPLTVALYLAGELLEQKINQPAAPARDALTGAAGWLVLAIGVAACLVNPHHVRALTLPPEFGLTAAGDLIENDPQFRTLFLSPLGKDYYKLYFGLSVAGLAYWLLVLLGLASFVFVYRRAPWRRLLVWAGFALMSLYNWRAIPFFAIVAGPITTLNWLDFAAHRLGAAPRLTTAWRNWSLGGRAVTVLLGLVLLIATVPGWLQRSQPAFRRIGWSVQADPSLQAMAETIRDWREAGLLPDEPHWFNMHQEIANYLAWYAPGERVFLDQNLPYSRATAEDYQDIRQGLEQMVSEQPEPERDLAVVAMDWRRALRDRRVRFWIFDNLSTSKADLVARWVLFTHPEEWVLCYLKGRIAVFAWRDPQQPASGPSAGLALDLKRAAFGPAAEPAPPQGVEPPPPRDWWHTCWDIWWRPDPPLSSDRASSALYDYRYQAWERPQQIFRHSRAWQAGVAAGAIASSLPYGPMPNSLLALSWSCTYNDLFPPGATQPARQPRDSERPALQAWAAYVNNQFVEAPSLYLAVRAARRALLVDPEDGPTYFRLGQTYQRLRDLPQERQLREPPLAQLVPPSLDAVRRSQMAAAFQNCLRLQPDDDRAAQAHEALFRVYAPPPYGELGYIDAAVHHLRQVLNKRTAAGLPPGRSPTEHNQMLDKMSALLTQLDGELERRRNRYEVNAATKTGLEKVQAALQEGLGETALTVVEQEVDPNNITPNDLPIVKMVTGVALDLGRLDKARELLPDTKGQPVRPDDTDAYVRLAAARGDYAEADRFLDDALQHAWQPPPGQPRTPDYAIQVSLLVGRVLLAEGQHLLGTPGMPWLIVEQPWLAQNASEFWRRRWHLEAVINGLVASQQQAELTLMRGWLALEAGHCVQAREHFQTVRDITVPGANWAPEVDRLNAWLVPQEEISRLQKLGYGHLILHDLSVRYLKWLVEESQR